MIMSIEPHQYRPRADRLTRNFPLGSHAAERTAFWLSEIVDTWVVSASLTILTMWSLQAQRMPYVTNTAQHMNPSTHSPHTATLSPFLSMLTQRMGSPDDRVT